jgi:ABC-2 type transport system permease protein
MFKTIFTFEIDYRKKRPVTFIYCGVIFLLALVGVISPNIKLGSPLGQVYANAPFVIYRMTLVASFALIIVNAAIMGVSVVRDFDHRMDSILFSTPLSKAGYLMGRFWGSFVVLVIIYTALPLGFICGFAIGEFVPWELPWRGQLLLSFDIRNYLYPFLLFLIPNLFITSALFFMIGSLGRKALIIYTQGFLFFILYQIGNTLLRSMDNQLVAGLLDPLGIQTFVYATHYWTSLEQNTKFVPVEGLVLYNRLLWMSIGFIALLITYARFSFTFDPRLNSAPQEEAQSSIYKKVLYLPHSLPSFPFGTYVKQWASSSFFYFRMVWKEIPFLSIAGGGLLLLFVNASNINVSGNDSYPTTSVLLNLINNSFGLFFLIIAIYYSGELIWKERSIEFNAIADSLPVSTSINLLGKLGGLMLVYGVMLFGLILCCVLIQLLHGYYVFALPVYFATLYSTTFVDLLLYSILAVFIQVIVNNKFLGYLLCILFVIMSAMLHQWGLEHDLWRFASGTLGMYSAMNGYGPFVIPFIWYKSYWLALAGLLFVVAVVFSVRGTDTVQHRWRKVGERFTRPILFFALLATLVFLFSGLFIYYSTTVIKSFEGMSYRNQKSLAYENQYQNAECQNKPEIVAIHLNIEIFPALQRFDGNGFYKLRNISGKQIDEIPVQLPWDKQLQVHSISFNRKTKPKPSSEDMGYVVYELDKPLLPGDSMQMNFELSFQALGFKDRMAASGVVENGTFLDASFFPALGYQKNLALNTELRSKFNFPDQRQSRRPDSCALKRAVNGNGPLHLSLIIGTDKDQTAVAPGALQKKWEKNDRTYFHYQTEKAISPYYFITSARYKRMDDQWNGVNLEIYYHPLHTYNLDALMQGMKEGLDYCSRNFSPYPYRQLRIVELPLYSLSSVSGAQTIGFPENDVFTFHKRNIYTEINSPYFQTVREVARQWWGHQIMPSAADGNLLLSEGLSEYTALMVMKRTCPPLVLERYTKHELDAYLKGRITEKRKEQALMADGELYVQQSKASLVLFGLQDLIGEDNLNAALQHYQKKGMISNEFYPSTSDLLEAIQKVVPDTLPSITHDLLRSVTFFETSIRNAVYKETGNHEYEVLLSTRSEKRQITDEGKEIEIPIDNWIDIGIYSKDENGQLLSIYLRKHHFTEKDNLITIQVKHKPGKVEIDPFHKLIDRHPDDNSASVSLYVDIPDLGIGNE